MIFYFSATGNSKHVADEIAAKTGDNAVSILDVKDSELNLASEKKLGFVSPTYAFGLPLMVTEFFKNIILNFLMSAMFFLFPLTEQLLELLLLLLENFLEKRELELIQFSA